MIINNDYIILLGIASEQMSCESIRKFLELSNQTLQFSGDITVLVRLLNVCIADEREPTAREFHEAERGIMWAKQNEA